jgi:CRP/FNR family cyclic AMP-dependent transcriptional regulator
VAKAKKQPFDVSDFLSKMDGGRTLQTFRKDQKVFAQGDPADAVFYIQEGKVKVSVLSQRGKEAVVALHGAGDFFGEGCLTGQPLRLATVSTMTDCVIMRIDKADMVRTLHAEPKLLHPRSKRSRRGRFGRSAFQLDNQSISSGALPWYRLASASMTLASTAKPSPLTKPASMQARTTASNTWRRMSLSRKRPRRLTENVE